MFAYIIWERNGKEFKSMLQVHKAEQIAVEMRKLGVEPKIVIAQPLHIK